MAGRTGPALDDDIFLDIDPRNGMPGGQQWKKTLLRKLASCEAMLCLVSTSWEGKAECVHEYRGAEDAGKQIFCARLESTAGATVSEWQWRDVFVEEGQDVTEVDIDDGQPPVRFAADGLDRLLRDVQTPDLGPQIVSVAAASAVGSGALSRLAAVRVRRRRRVFRSRHRNCARAQDPA